MRDLQRCIQVTRQFWLGKIFSSIKRVVAVQFKNSGFFLNGGRSVHLDLVFSLGKTINNLANKKKKADYKPLYIEVLVVHFANASKVKFSFQSDKCTRRCDHHVSHLRPPIRDN